MTRAFILAALAFGAAACSSADDALAPSDAATNDAASLVDATADADDGASGRYPAFAPEMPQIENHGGLVLDAARIVTVTWTADPNRATYEAFGDAIGGSDYWKAMKEYGVGPATSGAHVEITDPPQGTMSDTDLESFIKTHVEAAAGGWPGYAPENVYLVYVPEATTLTSQGADACQIEDGYHYEVGDATAPHIVYAVVVEKCHGGSDVVEYSTETASHELVESATDPHAATDFGWAGFDPDHLAWEVWQAQQDEVSDACEYYDDSNYLETAPFAYVVQKLWSNESALAGHAPCVHAPAVPYFNVSPQNLEPLDVTLPFYTSAMHTKGFRVPIGTTKKIRFGFYSDAPQPAWTFQVFEGTGLTPPGSSHLTISTTTTSGKNGDVAEVSVTADSVGSTTGILLTALSIVDGQPVHYMPVVVGVY